MSLNIAGISRRLALLTQNMEVALDEVVRDASTQTAQQASALAPVGDGSDGGHLRDCIRAEIERPMHGVATGRVVAANPHAAFVEFGTGRRGADSPAPPKWGETGAYAAHAGMPAQPYLYPAAMMCAQPFLSEAKEAARRCVRIAARGGSA